MLVKEDTATPKTGMWGCQLITGNIECTNCGAVFDADSGAQHLDTCPRCGAQMANAVPRD